MTNREAMSLLTDEQIGAYVSSVCCQKYDCSDCPFRCHDCGADLITSFLKEEVPDDHCKELIRLFGISPEKLNSHEDTCCHEAIETMLSEV